ncbi:hypothetical protein T459_11306 [Capsicum annuum]|uniref:non-specific serine/threonine protein kinase n=1 Tax=Capsicum annuum TaxID=4072 RepID=A0A2G2ZLM2_CAPAN|nr:hypothetical protein T459_11306 [Capsicum annuum]
MALTGVIPRELRNLTFLVYLDLGSNNFHGNLPQEMTHLHRLKVLDLSINSFSGEVPSWFGFLHQLQVLNLGNNSFTGSIPCSFSNVSTHETLNLNFNSIEGQIPKVIGSLLNLKVLNLKGNKLVGFIHMSLSNASRLESLEISYNSLQGNILEWIGNLHKHESEIPKEISNLVELEVLDLSGNSFSGSLDMEIFNISGLRVISISNNNLSGSLPPNMCSILPNIEKIYLNDLTNLVGTIPHSISNCSELTILELSNNQLTGLIPNSLGHLAHLQFLNLERNNLTSDSTLSFLISLTSCRNLTFLSVYLNPLNGMLPASTGNLSTSLRTFVADIGRIKGRIPNEVGNLSSLLDLSLSGNNLVGSIPTSIGNLRDLQRFNLSSNKFTGFIGDHICKLQHLGDIYLDQNQLSGSLPNCLGNITSLREIHLGSNKLSSNIPPSLGNLQDLVVLDLSSNNMVGSLPPEIGNLTAATLIDLSMNQFSNGIPTEIGGLQNLVNLSLRHNKLQGAIPDSMSNMVGLEFLHLSHNNISGIIPKFLEKLQNLKYFNVSVNKLYGEIPYGGPFKNLSSQFFIHNEALCGSSRFRVPPCPTSSKNKSNREKLLVLFLLLAITVVFVTMAFVLLWIRISYYELLQATDDLSESNLIGFGSSGSVYTECEVLRSLHHRNLVKVITSCSNLDFKALVLDYMPNGSLELYLYSHNYFLDIKQRLGIMIDVACGLEYLHHGCSLPVIHCDVKPSNVLLDEDMVAHLSDFGISKLLGEDQGDLYTKTLATFGYIAPEYGLEGLVSTKCDVYSYGVMLLETFTKRKPNEFEGDLSLKQWVSHSLPDAVMEVVDANLLTSTGNCLNKERDGVASIMKVALDCCNESPTRRTNMKDVVRILQKIKIQLLAC